MYAISLYEIVSYCIKYNNIKTLTSTCCNF